MFVSSGPHYEAQFYYIESGLLQDKLHELFPSALNSFRQLHVSFLITLSF